MRKELGTTMVEAGLITQDQLDEALQLQKLYGEKLASILVRQNFLTEKFAATYLGRQLRVPSIDLSRVTISLDLLRLVPLADCGRKMIFPVRLERGQLQLAMADPLNETLIGELGREHGMRLAPCIALEASIKNAIEEAAAAVRAGRRSFTPSALHYRLQTFSLDPRREALLSPTGPLPVLKLDRGGLAPTVETLGGNRVDYGKGFTETPRDSEPGGPRGATAPPVGAPGPRASAPAETPASPAPRRVAGRVLLVDGNGDTRKAAERLLRQAGSLRVVAVGSTADALIRLNDAPLLLVRSGLPHEDPLELCREARTLRPDLRIVLITSVHRGWAFEADVREAYGVDVVLGLPLDEGRLRRCVGELLGLGTTQDPEHEATVRKQLKAGVAALKRESVDEAIAALEEGLAVDPRSDLLHYYLGMAYERKGRVQGAISQYEAAIETNPGFEDALVLLATLYERAGMRRKSVEVWQRVLSTAANTSSRERIKAHIVELL